MIQITEKDFEILEKELDCAFDGLVEYAETLESIYVCENHLNKMHKIINKYKVKNKGE